MRARHNHVIVRAYCDTRAIDRPCPTCRAAVGEYCTRTDDRGQARIRRVPCVQRCPPSPPATDEPVQPNHRPPARSFDEPLHELDDDTETR